MRLGEVLCLTHADWHPGSGGTPFIEVVPRDHPHGARVKGGRGRRIYVSDELERLYGDYLWDLAERAGRAGLEVSDEWFCFVNLDGEPRFAPMRPERVYRITGRLRQRLPGLPEGWSPHWLRHTHASALLLAGVPLHVVSRRLGHADVQTTMDLYGWVTEDAELRAVAGWRSFTEGWRVTGASAGGLRHPGRRTRRRARRRCSPPCRTASRQRRSISPPRRSPGSPTPTRPGRLPGWTWPCCRCRCARRWRTGCTRWRWPGSG